MRPATAKIAVLRMTIPVTAVGNGRRRLSPADQFAFLFVLGLIDLAVDKTPMV
jgi:hypothetical protein